MVVDSSPPEETNTVIVGAGIIGCSAAYHLSELTDEPITVIDKGPIPEAGGSTLHAPGGLRQSNGNKTMATYAKYGRDLYTDLGVFDAGGSIEVARSQEQWEYIKRKHDHAVAYGIEGPELLEPEEVREYNKIVDTDKLVGGYYVPGDGQIQTLNLLETLVEEAESRNVTFHERTEMVDLETSEGGVDAVVTDSGTVNAERVLVATNIWSPLLDDMVGVDVPLIPCEHQYVVTESVDALDGQTKAEEDCGLRHQEASLYFHQHGEGVGIGSYDHSARLVSPETLPDHEDAMEHPLLNGYAVGTDHDRTEDYQMPASAEFTEDDFTSAWDETTDLFPQLEGVDYDRAFNGIFSFSVDGMPILGEAPAVDDLYVAAAIWITQSGGAGKVIADLMEERLSALPTRGTEIDRFQPHSSLDDFVTARGRENYETVYDIVHPREPSTTNRGLRRSPFYQQHKDLGADFVDSDGWERPRWFESNEDLLEEYDVPERDGWLGRYWSPIAGAEHQAVRDRGGLFDVSSLTPIDVRGPDAVDAVQHTFTSDMDIDVGRVKYTLLVDQSGGILGDMPVARLGDDYFRIMASGGANGTRQERAIREHVPESADASVTNRTSGVSGVAVWGPNAHDVLDPLTDADLSEEAFPAFTAQGIGVESVPALAMRVSYAGENGWELHVPTEYGEQLWETLHEEAQDHGVVPMGTDALNTLRIEKGFRLFGADITSQFDPYEAGLGFTVDLDTDFVGRDALAEAKDDVTQHLTCLTLDEPGEMVDSGMPVFDGEDCLGYVTSTDYGYSVGAAVAYAYLPTEYTDPGTDLEIQYQADRYAATVVDDPAYDA
jgi:glycine cleavage system T protein